MIAIIPARSGSKGLANKNIKNLLGKPLIAYTIEEALKSNYITEVIISTDCKEIEDIALQYGAKSYFLRPKNLATDSAKVIDTYTYTIDRLKKEYNFEINAFVVLQVTSPLKTSKNIDEAIELFKNKNADSVVSFTEESHPIQWNKYITLDNKIEEIFPEKIQNRQDFKPSYYPNGSIYIYKYSIILNKTYYTENSYAYIMPRKQSIDIDTIDDFEYVEFLIKKENNHE
ncbi:acylneuraminate cytidylyltransferase family protein [uncultured Arcobacter sp.]|uniref:acylneuraminate cytidylyltransferase family protein n=1 Tax=uncultured Arcobacter sp. TaxID=165434 RepID=UPI002604FE67|nr:acylneuraminate cytidylyltransferase family protein [uncultured Arcobacter sp.]